MTMTSWKATTALIAAAPIAFAVGIACGASGEAGPGLGGEVGADPAGEPGAEAATTAAAQQPAADPLPGFSTHVVATHFLRGQEYETHHYFKGLREGVLQGLVFREMAAGAPLIEVEWAIAQEVWEQLPAWQQGYWHPLFPAVDAGRVRLPDLGAEEEQEMLATVRGLYAQTFNLAGLDGELPVGLEGVAMATHLTDQEMRELMDAGAPR